MARRPQTAAEWQEAVDLAEVYLHVHSARAHGFIAGGPEIDVAHCEELLERGRKRGVLPSADCIQQLVPILAAGWKKKEA